MGKTMKLGPTVKGRECNNSKASNLGFVRDYNEHKVNEHIKSLRDDMSYRVSEPNPILDEEQMAYDEHYYSEL